MSDPGVDMYLGIMTAAAAAGRLGEIQGRLDDLLVGGRIVITEAALERLKQDAAASGVAGMFDEPVSIPEWALVSVVVIPDDGEPHDIGAGKVAIVSPVDHRTVIAFPADLLEVAP